MALVRGAGILVVGGTGMLGRPAAEALLTHGFAVRVLSSNAVKARMILGNGFQIAVGDVEDAAVLEAALARCQCAHVSVGGADDARRLPGPDHPPA